MPETETLTVLCKNCGSPVPEKFCPACGQSRQVNRLTFRSVFDEFAYSLLNLEHGFFHTLWQLTIRPGQMAREYVTGRRKPYSKPLQFYLIMLALYFTVSELLKIDFIVIAREIVNELGLPPTEPSAEQATRQILALVNQNIKIVYSVLVLIIAFALRVVYFNLGFNYVEMLTFSLYVMGYKYLFDLVSMLALVSPLPVYGRLAIAGCASIASNIYLIRGIAQFSGKMNWWSVVRALIALILAGALYGVLSSFLLKIQ